MVAQTSWRHSGVLYVHNTYSELEIDNQAALYVQAVDRSIAIVCAFVKPSSQSILERICTARNTLQQASGCFERTFITPKKT